jgi:hypothetical protein
MRDTVPAAGAVRLASWTRQYDAVSRGRFAVSGAEGWTDVQVRALLCAESPGALQLALRWTGPNDHYLFTLDGTTRGLVRRRGATTRLWSAPAPLPIGGWHELAATAVPAGC